jgi:hypothetical protein
LSLRKRLVRVANPAPFQQGVEVAVTLNGGTVHNTIAAEGISDRNRVTLRDALPATANSGNAISAGDYSGRSTNDVTAVMAYAQEGWTAEFEAGTGTELGTRYPGGGDTVYDILRSISDETGEIFRLKSAEASPVGPKRVVVWRRSHDAAGKTGTLRLVRPNDATMAADTANKNRAILIERPRHAGEYDPVTQVIPVAGDSRITLFGCSAAALARSASWGFDVVTTGLGLYAPPYVVNTALNTSIGVYQRRVSFSEVTVEGDNTAAITTACDRLLSLAIAYLRAHVDTNKDIEAVCISPVGIRPGQRVELYYESPTGEYTLDYTGTNWLYVQAVRRECSNGGQYPGAPITTLSLSPTPTRPTFNAPHPIFAAEKPLFNLPRPGGGDGGPRLSGGRTIGREIGRRLREFEKFAIRNNTPSVIYQSVGYGTGTGGDGGDSGGGDTSGGPYLPLAGGLMSGNISVGAGLTVDGVDVSAHAADPAAHHAAVTAADGSIAVSGQTVRIADAAAGDGLGLTAGALSVKTSTALGTKIVTDVVGVDAWANGGLFNGATGLQVKLPASSGLIIDATGLYSVAPATLSATTTNSRDAGTHAVTATDNANTTTGALLKGSVTGGLTLAALGVGDTVNTAATIYARSKTVDDYTLWLKQLASQTADMLRVEDTAGNALIRLTGGGDLESGNPGFVSGQTGWQMTAAGDLEANNGRFRGELHATTFVADEMHAVGGTVLVKTTGTVGNPASAGENVLGGVNSSFTLRANASWTGGGLNYFPIGSLLRIKPMGELASGEPLGVHDIHLEVTFVGALTGRDLAEGAPGTFPLTVIRRLGGQTGIEIPAGSAIVKWSEVGASGYTGAVSITGDADKENAAAAPFIDVFTVAKRTSASWGGVPPTVTPRVRVGNLRGVLGKSADEWGMAAGVDLSNTNVITQQYIVASSAGLDMRNVNMKIYGAANPTVEISSVGDLKLGIDTGDDATTTLRFYPSSGGLRVGPLVSGNPNLYWDGTSLHLRQYTTPVITLESSGASYFAGPMSIGAAGGIYQGTGTFASPTTGLKIYNSAGVGRLATYKTGVKQVELDSDGKLVIGNYGMTLDQNGMSIYPNADWAGGDAGIRFLSPAGTQFGKLYNFAGTGYLSVLLSTEVAGHTAGLGVGTHATGTQTRAYLYADTTTLTLSSDNTVAQLNNADLYIKERGLAVGYATTPALNRGQIACDFAGEHDFNALVLQDSGDIAHGMTTLVGTATYAAVGKFSDASGGVGLAGYSEGIIGAMLAGYATTASTTTATSSNGAVVIKAAIKSGTGVTAYGATANLFSVANNTDTQFMIKGNGDFYYNGAGAAYDDRDDVGLLRTLSRELWAGTIHDEWDRFIDHNRRHLIDAGIMSEFGFINGAALNRLVVGAIGQLAARLNRLEGNNGH